MMFPKFMFQSGCWLRLLVLGIGLVGVSNLSLRPAIAQTTLNTNLTLDVSARESFVVFINRAEANAAVKVQELFDQDLLRTEVRLTVLGQRGLVIAPVLKLRVTRREWTAYPDPEIWSVYYPESHLLLNFAEGLPPVKSAPQTAPSPPNVVPSNPVPSDPVPPDATVPVPAALPPESPQASPPAAAPPTPAPSPEPAPSPTSAPNPTPNPTLTP